MQDDVQYVNEPGAKWVWRCWLNWFHLRLNRLTRHQLPHNPGVYYLPHELVTLIPNILDQQRNEVVTHMHFSSMCNSKFLLAETNGT